MSVSGTLRPKENVVVDFAAQFMNAFNHTQFRPAMNMVLGATSVQTNSPLGFSRARDRAARTGRTGTVRTMPGKWKRC